MNLKKLFDWESRSVAPSRALSHHFGNACTKESRISERVRKTERKAGEVEVVDEDKWWWDERHACERESIGGVKRKGRL